MLWASFIGYKFLAMNADIHFCLFNFVSAMRYDLQLSE